MEDNDGKTASEFPIVYYLISLIWKVFGKHEWIFRLFNLLVSLLGMLALLKIFEHFLKDSFWSLFSVCLLFTSGIYVYYSFNFLMNTTAFNMALIGWYFFFKYYSNHRVRFLYFTFACFLIGGLLKMSSLISFIAMCGLFLFDWIQSGWSTQSKQSVKQKEAIPHRSIFMILATVVVLVIILWISYVKAYNSKWNSGVFLVGILPIWDLTIDEISAIVENIRHIRLEEYYYRPTQILFLIGLLSIWGFYRKVEHSLLLLTSLLSLGFLGLVLLFFAPLGQHDYYVIDLLILSVFIMLSILTLLIHSGIKNLLIDLHILKLAAIVFIILNVSHTQDRMEVRYHGWLNSRHQNEFFGYGDIEPILDSLGIDDSAKVISADDPTINITLYLMNRRGWTIYGTNLNDSATIAGLIEMGAGFLLYHKEQDFSDNPNWDFFVTEEIGKHKNVTICKLGLPELSSFQFENIELE